ncbi:DUF4910 domain-containing protein [Sphaerisporangium aureirubrum]|uniref:DUF4910 domain-containing protein n=1 Tax=Sphaerisporangium aureirubrum TaxID=1544736 RepID=A0ABW1NSB9_9ACTN
MSVRNVVRRVHSGFDVDAAMADVAAVCGFDRYQASAGIAAAAAYVAGRAEEAGLKDVRVHEFPADGERRWWSFRAPTGWTPVRAVLSEVGAGAAVRYPEEPFTLGAYSAGTGDGGVEVAVVRAAEARPGTLVVHDEPEVGLGYVLELAESRGAVGVVTEQVSPGGGTGRVELRAGGPLFAFSVPRGVGARLMARGRARVTVTAEPGATMPVVTGVLPGDEADEILLSAHLCHPRPSANDNASGVAALLGTARVLAGAPAGVRRRRGVRFLWGPEFTGTAAYLHDIAAGAPFAAVNVDMAGEDQRLCGGPLIVERCPDHLPGFVSALAEHVVASLPQASRSYAGTVPCDTWTWRATPFAGASDHSLLADRSIGTPVVTLGHWPDRFNHSSADTLDKVDPAELRRTGTVAATMAAVLSGATPADRPELETIAVQWTAARLLECLPASPALLRHRAEVGIAALGWLDDLCGEAGSTDTRRWVEDLAAHIGTRLPYGEPPAAGGGRVWRCWPGPFNVRGFAEAAGEAGRRWVDARLAADRSRGYALMLALAHAVDGVRDRAGVARHAELASGIPVDAAFAEEFLDLLVAAGWAGESATPDPATAPGDVSPIADATGAAEGGADAPDAPAHA